jgi:hypothetical protein
VAFDEVPQCIGNLKVFGADAKLQLVGGVFAGVSRPVPSTALKATTRSTDRTGR